MHDHVQQFGQRLMSLTARVGQDDIERELKDLTAQLASLDDDAGQLEASLESTLRAYEELDRMLAALTEWLGDTESHLEWLNTVDFFALENLEANLEVSLSSALILCLVLRVSVFSVFKTKNCNFLNCTISDQSNF